MLSKANKSVYEGEEYREGSSLHARYIERAVLRGCHLREELKKERK